MSKTVLITGASRGIGRALALRFARAGYSLSLCCRSSEDQLLALAEELHESLGITVLTSVGSVGDHAFVEQMISRTLQKLGHIDVLINNAGISYVGLLSEMSPAEWDELLAVNLTGVFSCCRCVIPSMVHRKQGKIINISSVWGARGASCEAAYAACKGGVDALTRSLGKELAPSGIQVNAIACGMIDTEMNRCFTREDIEAITQEIPAGRMGSPQEVAALAFALCQGQDYLNGQIITLDGGWM